MGIFDSVSPEQAPLFIALGVVLLIGSAAWGYRGWRTSRWPRVTGEVLAAELEHGPRAIALQLRYRYTVGGRDYVGERQAIGGVAGFAPDDAAEAARRCRPGSPIGVYYDPADPASAVLEPGTGFLPYLGVLLGISVLALGVIRLLF